MNLSRGPIIGLIYRRLVIYFRRLFCRGDKFMCREIFPNRKEYYTQPCVLIDNNNNYNNGSSGNNHCTSPPLPWQTHIHTGPPSGNIVACTEITPYVPVYHMSNSYILPPIVNNLCLPIPYTSGPRFSILSRLCAFTKSRTLLNEIA